MTPPRKLRPEMRISEAMERVVQKAMAQAIATIAIRRWPRSPPISIASPSGGEVEPPRPTASTGERPRTTLWLAAVGVLAGTAALFAIDRFTRAPAPARRRRSARRSQRAAATPPPPPAPKTVVLHVETTPPGAEIRQGSRVFGAAPRDILLPRSEVPAQLTFHLDGYEDGDDADRADHRRLGARQAGAARARTARARGEPGGAATPTKQPKEQQPSTGETLPNPY